MSQKVDLCSPDASVAAREDVRRAVDRALYFASRLPGDLSAFVCTATGWGSLRATRGEVGLDVAYGKIDIERIDYTPYEA